MHDVLNRQLIAPAIAVLLSCTGSNVGADDTREASVADQVQAARLMQAALAAREANPEEWRTLDNTYAALVAKNPRDVAIRNARAEFLWDRGEQPRAVTEWEAALQLDPANAVVLDHLGESALAVGEVRKSAGYFSRAVASEPNNAGHHFALANVLFLFRHELLDAAHPDAGSLLTNALAHFAEAARFAPTNADYARAYAETFYSVPDPDWQAALAAWEKVQRLGPKPEFALLHQARIHLKLGHPGAARTCLSKIESVEYQILKDKLDAQAESQEEMPLNPRDLSGAKAAQFPPRKSSKPVIDGAGRSP